MKNVILRRPLSFVLAVFLLFSLLPPVRVWAAAPDTVYLDPANGVDTNAGTEAAPVETLEKAIGLLTEGGTVVFLSDLELTANTLLPAYGGPITFTSKTGAEGIRSAGSLRMGGDSTFQNITLTLTANSNTVYVAAEGHDLTIGQGVTTVANGTNKFHLTAGGRFANCTGNPVVTVQSGDWAFGYVTHGYKITGDVTLNIEGDYISGFATGYNGDITGNVTMNLSNFTGNINIENTHADGEVGGNVTVNLYDGAAPSTIAPSKGVVAGNITVNVLGDTTGAGTFTGTGANSALVLSEGTFDATVTDFGSVAVNVPGEKTLTLASSITADTVTCAGTLAFQTGGSLTATAVTGTVNCTLTGEVLTNKVFVTAPADSDIRFPEDSGVTCEDGKWMILDMENFKGLVIKADSAVTMSFYAHYLNGDTAYNNRNNYKITPDYTTTNEGVTAYYFPNYKGEFCYIASQTDHYTIRQQIYMSAEEAARCTEYIVQMHKRGDGWDHSYYFGQTDELLAAQETDENQKWHTEVDLVTPVFTLDKPAHQMTTQNEMETFIADLADKNDNMYVFSIGKSAKYELDIPIVFFTKSDLSDCTTWEQAAAKLQADGLPNVGYKAQMHGDEHAAGEGALGVIELLSRSENKDLLDSVNIYVMPRINPDGAKECARNLRGESQLDSTVPNNGAANQDPNRHTLTLAVHETRLYLRTVQLLDPIAELDGHERQRYSMVGDIQIGSSWRGGSDTQLLNIQVELIQSMFGALEDVDLSGAWYSDQVNAAKGDNTRGYASLQGRVHILMETRGIYIGNEAYGSRTASQIVSAMAYLRYCAENAQTIKAAVEADQQMIATMGKTYEESETITLLMKDVATPEYNMQTEQYDLATGTKAYTQKAYLQLPDRTRVAPTAYVIPKDLPKIDRIIELMELQEIAYYQLPANTAILLQQYSGVVDETRVTSDVTLSEEHYVAFPAGAYVMQMDQVNGYVLGHLMEPDTASFDLVEQGRIAVNANGTFPLYRYIHDLTEGEVGIAYTTAQAAPENLVVTDATMAANDGVITGLDAQKQYEYRHESATAYTALEAGATQITGLIPGTYYVRFQADENGVTGLDAICAVHCSMTVYLSTAGGNDENNGYTEVTAVKSLETAYAKLSEKLETAGTSANGTIILLDDYTITSDARVDLPAHTFPVTIMGKTASVKLIFKPTAIGESLQQLAFHGPTTLDDLVFRNESTSKLDYIFACGNPFTIGRGVTTSAVSNLPTLVGGDHRMAIVDAEMTILGGKWYSVYVGSFREGHTGTAKLTVDGAVIQNNIRGKYEKTTTGDFEIDLKNTTFKGVYPGYTGDVSGATTITLRENAEGAVYTNNGSSGNITGTVSVVIDGADLSKITFGNTSGTVTKDVLVFASGDAIPVEGFDEIHINTDSTVSLISDLEVAMISGGGTVELNGYKLTGEGNYAITADVTTVSLRANAAGVYFTGNFQVADALEATYGIALSTDDKTPVAEDGSTSRYTIGYNSVLVKDIMEVGSAENGKNANTPIYARAYVKLTDGTVIYADTVTVTLQQVVIAADAKWDDLTATQQRTLLDMYETFGQDMLSWQIPHIKANA